MKIIKKPYGTLIPLHYIGWKITWPYATERYIYFGSKTDAALAAKKVAPKTNGRPWPYKVVIKEAKL